jgi:DNA-binding transcriptional ArsR family regulator
MITGIRLKEKVKPFAKKMQGIAHPIRLSILYLLAFKDYPLHEIAENLDHPPNLVSHHMKTLLSSGWVEKKKWSRYMYYHIKHRMLFDWYRLFFGTPLEKEVISKKLQ